MRPAVDDESFATDWGLVAMIPGAEAALATTGVTTTGVVAKVLPGIGAKKAGMAMPAAGSAGGVEPVNAGDEAAAGAVARELPAAGESTAVVVSCLVPP